MKYKNPSYFKNPIHKVALGVHCKQSINSMNWRKYGGAARFGASSIKIPYGSMERTIPPTVSPVENNAAFSSHVPKSSL